MLTFPAALTTLVTSIVFYKTKPAHFNQRNGGIQRLYQKILKRAYSYIRYSSMIVSVGVLIVMGIVTVLNLPRGNMISDYFKFLQCHIEVL